MPRRRCALRGRCTRGAARRAAAAPKAAPSAGSLLTWTGPRPASHVCRGRSSGSRFKAATTAALHRCRCDACCGLLRASPRGLLLLLPRPLLPALLPDLLLLLQPLNGRACRWRPLPSCILRRRLAAGSTSAPPWYGWCVIGSPTFPVLTAGRWRAAARAGAKRPASAAPRVTSRSPQAVRQPAAAGRCRCKAISAARCIEVQSTRGGHRRRARRAVAIARRGRFPGARRRGADACVQAPKGLHHPWHTTGAPTYYTWRGSGVCQGGGERVKKWCGEGEGGFMGCAPPLPRTSWPGPGKAGGIARGLSTRGAVSAHSTRGTRCKGRRRRAANMRGAGAAARAFSQLIFVLRVSLGPAEHAGQGGRPACVVLALARLSAK